MYIKTLSLGFDLLSVTERYFKIDVTGYHYKWDFQEIQFNIMLNGRGHARCFSRLCVKIVCLCMADTFVIYHNSKKCWIKQLTAGA